MTAVGTRSGSPSPVSHLHPRCSCTHTPGVECDASCTVHGFVPGTVPINIVFDGPPSHEAPRFVEVEDDAGRGLGVGQWIERPDGYWVLRITSLPVSS